MALLPNQKSSVLLIMHTSTRTTAVHLAFFLLLTVCLHQLCHAEEASSEAPAKKKITKLQIGIKKRAENCSVRGSKGDTLHIHYRVSSASQFNRIDLLNENILSLSRVHSTIPAPNLTGKQVNLLQV